jgi:hypothetical protein
MLAFPHLSDTYRHIATLKTLDFLVSPPQAAQEARTRGLVDVLEVPAP